MPVGDSEGRTPGGDSRPTPDPTSLTTAQLDKGLLSLRELIEATIDGNEKLMLEKFSGMEKQLDLAEHGRLEQKADTEKALIAALAAAKEAVKEQAATFSEATAKSEAATSKQLDLILLGQSDLKTRVERIENIKAGGKEMYAAIAGLVVLVLAVLGGIAAFR